MKMLRLLLVSIVLCGVIYPGIVTLIGLGIFPEKAQGSLITKDGKIVGSKLLAQKFERPEFFHPRPSAGDFATVSSGASHASPTQHVGTEARQKRQTEEPEAGVDAWTTSGSGLDPHVSPKTAFSQIKRVAQARGMSEASLKELVSKFIEGPTLGIWGQPRVNVLELNLALREGNNGDTRSTPGVP